MSTWGPPSASPPAQSSSAWPALEPPRSTSPGHRPESRTFQETETRRQKRGGKGGNRDNAGNKENFKESNN